MVNLQAEIKEKKRVALSSVIAAIFLTLAKFAVGLTTGSLGIISEALHSTLDLGAAIITYFAMKITDKPADELHRYGHGKVESIAALTEALLLLFTCIWITVEAIERILGKKMDIEVNLISFAVLIGAILIDISRAHALSKAAKKYQSSALAADALHFSSDVLSTIVVIAGLIFVQFGFSMADPLAAIGVAILVAIASIKLAIKTLDSLMDKVPQEVEDEVKKSIESMSNVKDFHKLRLRRSGKQIFIDLHVQLDKTTPFPDVHKITTSIEKKISELGYSTDVIVHPEPIITNNKKDEEKITRKEITEILTSHSDKYTDFHNLSVKKIGEDVFVNVHLVVPKDLNIAKAHNLCNHLEKDIAHNLSPSVKINIHVEPCNGECKPCSNTNCAISTNK